MDKPNPFFEEYERKPEWLKQKLHVPFESDMDNSLDTITAKVKNGRSKALIVVPAAKGIGITHFINRELKPALEARGCICAIARKNGKPWDDTIRNLLDLPQIVTLLAAPNESYKEQEQIEWLPESVAATRKRSLWRKQCGISSEPREPYAPKIFSHTLGKKIDRQEPVDDDDDECDYHSHGRHRDSGKKFTNITALGELASQNNRVLCVITQVRNLSYSECNSKSDAKFFAEQFGRDNAPYLEVKNILVIAVMDRPYPFLVKRLGASHTIARLSKKDPGWVKKILKAHQNESGTEWFTDEALDIIVKRTKGRINAAMGFCAMMADRAFIDEEKFPLDGKYVKKQIGAGKHESYCKDVRIRF